MTTTPWLLLMLLAAARAQPLPGGTTAQAPTPAAAPATAGALTLPRLVEDTVRSGKESSFAGDIPGYLGETREIFTRSQGRSSPDQKFHGFAVRVERALYGVAPTGLVLTRYHVFKDTSEYRFYSASLDGKLLKAVHLYGKVDAKGAPLPGSGFVYEQDPASPEAQAAFQAELDLWLQPAGKP